MTVWSTQVVYIKVIVIIGGGQKGEIRWDIKLDWGVSKSGGTLVSSLDERS